MIRLNIINSTLISNTAIYIGAYISLMREIAILNNSDKCQIQYIVPYLKQMHLQYNIYSNEKELLREKGSRRFDAVLCFSDKFISPVTLNSLENTLTEDIIIINSERTLLSTSFKRNWYLVTIFNSNFDQTTYVYHTNAPKNIPPLLLLNSYQAIRVELT